MARVLSGFEVAKVDVAAEPGKAVSVGTSSVEVAAANKDRVEITVVNDHATNVLYLRLSDDSDPAVASEGLRLNAAGGSWSSSAYTGAVQAIATGAATPALVTEV